MIAPPGGGQLFDLGRFARLRPLVTASEVLDVPMAINERQSIWRQVGVLPALTVVAELFADLDLAVITDSRSDVERTFIDGAVGASRLRAALLGHHQGSIGGGPALHPLCAIRHSSP
jgi:hypothetical protein